MAQEDIDLVLRQGSGVQGGKYRIYLHFQQNASAKENAEFLKKEYGTGGRTPALPVLDIDEWHDAKGITLTRGKRTGPEAKILLPWMKVQKRIGELVFFRILFLFPCCSSYFLWFLFWSLFSISLAPLLVYLLSSISTK